MTRNDFLKLYAAEFEQLFKADTAWENDDDKEDEYYNTLFAIADKIGDKAAKQLEGIIAVIKENAR